MEQNITEWGRKGQFSDQIDQREFAPIVLFVYNRVDHVRQTVEALKSNVYAEHSVLFIYSDEGKNTESTIKVAEVRRYIKTITGFKDITIIERNENWGLARNIIDGVTHVVNRYGKVIVLEDDLVTSPYFLQYMNDALDFYKEKDRVMQISGYNFPINNNELPETYFFRASSSWGWATWKDRWDHFERDTEKLLKSFSREEIYQFNIEGTFDYWRQIIQNQRGEMYTWAIFFYAVIFKLNGLVLYPAKTMIQNIGFDESGVHCGKTQQFDSKLADKPVMYFNDTLNENTLAIEHNKEYFCTLSLSFLRRLLGRLRKIIQI